MRVISGEFGGRTIPFNNRKFGNARVTSDFMKEAVFGTLGPDLTGIRMLDLFSGSGQIGLEAVSRGATVWMNDRDRKRVAFVKRVVGEWVVGDRVTITELDSLKLLNQLATEEERFGVIYIDPPYDATTNKDTPLSEACLRRVSSAQLLLPDGRLLVQHDRRTELPTEVEGLWQHRSRRYGDSFVSTYRHDSEEG